MIDKPNIKRFDWEQFTINIMWVLMFVYVIAAFGVINAERTERQNACDNKHGIVIQSKSGEFYCVREKAIIK